MVKNLPAMQETQALYLGQEDSPGGANGTHSRKIPLGERMAPTPVFLPGESHGHNILVGCGPPGHKDLDTTEQHTHTHTHTQLGGNVLMVLQPTLK